MSACSPVRKCQPPAADARSYWVRYARFLMSASSGPSSGEMLTVTISNSRPADQSIPLRASTIPFSVSVHSIGQR